MQEHCIYFHRVLHKTVICYLQEINLIQFNCCLSIVNWFGARKDPDSDYESDPDDPQKKKLMYSANTMKNFGYALNHILKNKGHLYDIMSKNTLSFKKSQQAFADSQKELKELRKAQIHSALKITEEGKKLLF